MDTNWQPQFLGAFVKLRKANYSFISARPYGKTQLQMDGFSWNLIRVFFENLSRKSVPLTSYNNGYFTWRRGHAVGQLVEALRYQPEGRGFDSRGYHWHNPSGRTMVPGLTQPLTEMSTRNISRGDKGGRCVALTTLPPSCVDCLEIWEPQPPGTLRACPGL